MDSLISGPTKFNFPKSINDWNGGSHINNKKLLF